MSRKNKAISTSLTTIVAITLLMFSLANSNPTPESFGQNAAQKNQPKAGQANKQNQQNKKKAKKKKVATKQLVGDHVANMLRVARQNRASVLSEGDSYDDFASVVQTSDGTLYAAYAAYYNGHDQIRLHRRLRNGRWSTRSYVPLVRGRADIWMPQLAVDASDNMWLIWCEQTGQTPEKTGNFDLYARPLIGTRWGKIVRLTDDPKPDINPHVATDADHNIHVVWQAHPDNSGDVQYCRFDGKSWSKPLAVTSDEESDWYPRVAVDNKGKAWITFDSYRNGDYDVFLTSVTGTKLGNVIPIADSTYYEAHASVACTPDGRVWIAWEQGGHNWGKDQGYWLNRQSANRGTALGNTRSVKVACWFDGKLLAAPDVKLAVPQPARRFPSSMAELASGPDGRLWLRFRHLVVGRERRPGRYTKGWTENVTWLGEDGWAAATRMPASAGRISVFSRALPLQNGSLVVAYSGDARAVQNYHRPIQDTVLVATVAKPDGEVKLPKLAAYEPPAPPAGIPAWNTTIEKKQVDAIRKFRVDIDGKSHRIVRGDLHRHTELSWDVGPGNDGSYLDFYRYMIDVASMDFGGLTDHQGGGHYAYWWWLTEKSADMYYLSPRFVPLYGYERSAKFPNGHRNVFHSYRGVPVFPFQTTLNQTGVFPGVASGALVDNDTKLLYEYLHNSGGVCISHTSGTSSMGTDWRDNDPTIEPVVEIYQGARNSYEALGAPRVHSEKEPPRRAPGGFQQAGLLWKAYDKGYRLGTIASSDHGSTHISYALVYTPENERAAVIEAIRKRQTYGATDNLIVDFKANGHFMGREFKTKERPQLTLRVVGTGRIAKVELIRNNEYIYSKEPKAANVELKFTDMTAKVGTNFYYFRILQANGEVAWSSPVWVNYEK